MLTKPMLTNVLLLTVNIGFFKKPMLTDVLLLIVNIGFFKKPMLTHVNIGFYKKTDVNECVIIDS